jgi:hypothetical protein
MRELAVLIKMSPTAVDRRPGIESRDSTLQRCLYLLRQLCVLLLGLLRRGQIIAETTAQRPSTLALLLQELFAAAPPRLAHHLAL